jgi:MoxR-like ATPase
MTAATTGAAPTVTTEQASWFAQSFGALVTNIEQAVLGKQHIVKLAITCLLSEGHLLIEDFPGTGKTSLAKAIANSVQGTHSRIQFTPDLLPSDVTGVTIYDQRASTFEFHNGPIFATIVLADEINRASPKTQSALLEVMEEGHVTVDGIQHPVGRPFMVIATQNPIEQAGTYRLPEAQLDRFLMKTSLGYPDHATTVALLASAATRDRAGAVENVITTAAITQMSGLADAVHVDPGILGYVSELATESRRLGQVRLGLSVRGCLAFVRVAKTWALADGRSYVIPDDIKELAVPVLSHRLLLDAEAEFSGVTIEDVIAQLLSSVRPPTVRAL